MTPAPADTPPPSDELDPALAAVRRWRRELVEVGGPNTLLWRTDGAGGRLELTHAHPAGLALFLSGRDARLSDLIREPRALADAVQQARALHRTSRRLWEERGLASCFLAAGIATWQMRGQRVPSAPVFLRPCELVPRDVGQSDFDVVVSPTTELNPAFVELVRAELGVELDGAALARMSWGRNGFDPEPAYREIARACAALPGFTIERRLGIGIYPYAKLAMVADLADTSVARHPLVRALAGLPTTLREPRTDPEPMPLVLPADPEQRAALAAIHAGDDVVVHGAPGTGTTQLVANALAGLVAAGRSVLLVSHKRAAIDDVRRRLAEVGLDLVTEAHDGPDLRHQHGPLTTAVPVRVEPQADTAADLDDAATRLQGRLVALHAVRQPWGVSAYQAQGAMVELSALDPAPRSRVRLDADTLRGLTPATLDEATRSLVRVASDGAWLTTRGADPWRGARVTSAQEADAALAACERLVDRHGIEALLTRAAAVAAESGLPEPTTAAEIADQLDLVTGVRQTLDAFVPEVWDAPLPDMLAATSSTYRQEHGAALGMVQRTTLRRDARRLVRPGLAPQDLHEGLAVAHDQLTRWRELTGPAGRPVVPHGIDVARERLEDVEEDLRRLEPVLATTAAGGDLTRVPLAGLRTRLAELVRQRRRLAVLPQVTPTLDELRGLGLEPLLDDLATRGVPAEQVAAEVRHVWWSSLLDEVRRADPRYGRHDGASLHAVAEELRRLDARAQRERAQVVARATREASACRAISPYEVGALLQPGPVMDTVILLEASQLPVAQAVSAVSRGRQVVVIGDPQQLPPAELSFAVDARPEDDVLADQRAVSVLDVLGERLPVHTLRTHYRVVDDRLSVLLDDLLAVDEPTVVPPASTRPRIHLELVERADRSPLGAAPVSTPEEVDRVVRLVLGHARNAPQHSLGVVTLHPEHAERVREGLLAALAALEPGDPALDFFAEDRPDGFWVKPVDDVQGDTRDDVILAVGYGLDDAGQATHRFGSLSRAHGERRMATAATRARATLTVVSTLDADALTQVAENGGVELLARVVALAATPPRPARSQGPLVDPVMRELAERLRGAGLEVTERAGRGVGPVELAVRDPRRVDGLAVAVESDGTVHATAPSPVDREVLRPALLERQGWVPVRVWTPDLFVAPEHDVARIVDLARGTRPGRSRR